jgi:AAA domain-containing protein
MAMQMNIPAPRRAEKKKVKLKMGIQGPSGGGKTWGALSIASNLWPGAKICVIDTENGSAELYADHFQFDTIPLGPPFHTDRYIAAIEAVVKHGYDVCIIDQISHQWDGEGGILRRKEELDQRPGSNSYTNWSKFTPEHQRFKEAIVQAPLHIIATMRAKQDYILETNDKGKQTPRKVGMAAVQREGFEYEFSLLFDVQMDHRATVNKDRTNLFNEMIVDLASPKVADALRAWMESGAELKPESTKMLPEPATQQSQQQQTRNAQNSNGNGRGPQPTPAQQPGLTPFRQMNAYTVNCHAMNVEARETKTTPPNPFRAIKINGKIEGQSLAFCFHTSLFAALDAAKNKSIQFEYELSGDRKSVSILNVIAVDDQEYRDGKPYIEPPPPAAQGGALFADVDDGDAELELVGVGAGDSTEISDDDIPF